MVDSIFQWNFTSEQLPPASPGHQHCWVCWGAAVARAHFQSWGSTALEGDGLRDFPPCSCRYRSHTHLAAVPSGTILPDPLVSGCLLCLSPGAAVSKAWEHQIRTLLGLSSQGTAGQSWRQRQVLSNTPVSLLQDTFHLLRDTKVPQLSSTLTVPSL